MDIKIYPNRLAGSVTAPPSKSFAHRAFICAALSDKPTEIFAGELSADVKATVNSLVELGAKITGKGESYTVFPIDKGKLKGKAHIDAKESGSTLRFLVPVLSALGVTACVNCADGLKNRPIKDLLLSLNGESFSSYSLPFEMSGKLSGNNFSVNGEVSSQYITGILLALGINNGSVSVTGKACSLPYIDITASVMRDFGVVVSKINGGYEVCGVYCSPKSYRVEGDWSLSSFFAAANYLGGDISINGLNASSVQGDKCFSQMLGKSKLDLSDTPDLFPVLAAACAIKGGEYSFSGVKRLKYKESDRLVSMANNLRALGVETEENGKEFTVRSSGVIKGGVKLDSYNDHRIFMANVLIATFAKEPCVITGAECVEKSYPSFIKDYIGLGGKADVL